MMLQQLSRLCYVLPADADEIGPPPLHPPPSPAAAAGIGSSHRCHHRLRCCRGQALALIRKLTTRICASYCFTYFQTAGRPLVKSPSDNFQDMAGVDLSEVKLGGNNPRIFSYAELYIGTHGFSEDEVLGSGGFGRVYRAVLPSDGTLVAVKYMAGKEEHFARKTFEAELVAVANLRHRNLVRLRGWCVRESDDHDQQQLLLVYDYMPNRSLDRVLFRRTTENNAAAAGNFVLDWDQRMRIARGLAAALFYLHEQLETQIIHRDVKSSNVMLDSHYNARLGDFGLARWLEHDFVVVETEKAATRFMGNNNNNHHRFRMADTTRIGGTIGYLPPESFQRLYTATAKSDVFGFGIVLLEIASGRRALDLSYPDDQIILLDWIRRLADEGALVQAADRQLPNPDGLMELVLHLGLLCTVHHPKSRPNMRWVLGTLSGDVLGKLPGLPLFKTQPLYYISLSPPSNTATSSSCTPTTTTTATTISSTPPPIIGISNPTIYITAATGEGETTVYETSTDSTTQGGGTGGGESKTGSGSGSGSSGGNNGRSRGVDVKPLPPLVEMPREISYKEIASATNNFSEERRVAELDFGTAYHGFLEDGRHIMVKRLGIKTCPALRARFSKELKNLGRLRHRNLVQLRGWCTEQGEMLVVYDFSASRLLSHLLFHHQIRGRGRGRRRQSESTTTLQWHDRYNIIKSLASAILYLHEEWDEQVIHRNITSNSIVIDHDMNPRLTSFALAEFLTRNEHDNHHIVMTDKKTSVQGIFGYISPEYMESGKANTEADIYSFGVVMLEMISGRMAVDFRYPEVLLVKRVHEFEEEGTERGALLELADERLDGEFDAREFSRVATLGLACTRSNPELRPTIRQIVSILDGNDSSFIQGQKKKEKTEEWRETNAVSLALIRGIQALGIL